MYVGVRTNFWMRWLRLGGKCKQGDKSGYGMHRPRLLIVPPAALLGLAGGEVGVGGSGKGKGEARGEWLRRLLR